MVMIEHWWTHSICSDTFAIFPSLTLSLSFLSTPSKEGKRDWERCICNYWFSFRSSLCFASICRNFSSLMHLFPSLQHVFLFSAVKDWKENEWNAKSDESVVTGEWERKEGERETEWDGEDENAFFAMFHHFTGQWSFDSHILDT